MFPPEASAKDGLFHGTSDRCILQFVFLSPVRPSQASHQLRLQLRSLARLPTVKRPRVSSAGCNIHALHVYLQPLAGRCLEFSRLIAKSLTELVLIELSNVLIELFKLCKEMVYIGHSVYTSIGRRNVWDVAWLSSTAWHKLELELWTKHLWLMRWGWLKKRILQATDAWVTCSCLLFVFKFQSCLHWWFFVVAGWSSPACELSALQFIVFPLSLPGVPSNFERSCRCATVTDLPVWCSGAPQGVGIGRRCRCWWSRRTSRRCSWRMWRGRSSSWRSMRRYTRRWRRRWRTSASSQEDEMEWQTVVRPWQRQRLWSKATVAPMAWKGWTGLELQGLELLQQLQGLELLQPEQLVPAGQWQREQREQTEQRETPWEVRCRSCLFQGWILCGWRFRWPQWCIPWASHLQPICFDVTFHASFQHQ